MKTIQKRDDNWKVLIRNVANGTSKDDEHCYLIRGQKKGNFVDGLIKSLYQHTKDMQFFEQDLKKLTEELFVWIEG